MAGLEPSEDTMSIIPLTLKRAYETGEFSDLTIWVNDDEFNLHKLIVGEQSPILKEKIQVVNDIKIEQIKDLAYDEAYEAMFRFMYGLKYDDCIWSDNISFHFDVFRVASEYEVLGLQKLAFEEVKKIASKNAWDVDQFINMLDKKREYNTTEDEKLEEFLIATCHEHIAELVDKTDFELVMERDDAIGKNLILSWGDSQKKYCCPQCEKVWPMDIKYLSSPSFCPNCGHREEDYEKFVI